MKSKKIRSKLRILGNLLPNLHGSLNITETYLTASFILFDKFLIKVNSIFFEIATQPLEVL